MNEESNRSKVYLHYRDTLRNAVSFYCTFITEKTPLWSYLLSLQYFTIGNLVLRG